MSFDVGQLTREQCRAAWTARFGTGWVHFSDIYDVHSDDDSFGGLAFRLRDTYDLEYDGSRHAYRITKPYESL